MLGDKGLTGSIVNKALDIYGAPVYVKHEVVHNKVVVNDLKQRGAIFVEDINEIPDESLVIFSAHGVSSQVEETTRSRNLNETFFPLVNFLLIYNSGIAFGIFDDKGIYASYFLLVITLLISIYLIWLIYYEEDFNKKIALSFVTGGAFGNILDRLNDGKVTDFLHLEIMNFSFFIFNLADLFITIGAILIIYFEIIYKPKND